MIHKLTLKSKHLRLLPLLVLSCLSACSDTETQATAPDLANTSPAPASSMATEISVETLSAAPMSNYLTTGGSLSNQRYSPLDEINTSNISELKAEWHAHVESGLGPNHSGQGEPLVIDGKIYMVTGQNDVIALSLDTGEILWKYNANLENAGVVVCCGWVQRGLSVGEGSIYVGTLDARLLALDMDNGEVQWETRIEDPSAGYSITGGTRYFEGKVYVGLAGGEYQTRGRMLAFDASTGENVWTFYTVPGPGEFGHDTWPDYNDAWMYGGAPIWQTPAIDPDLGLLYFSTGNASPDLNGNIREGDNLFTVSILALDLDTGEYRWHFQQTRHDIWDYDSSSPVVLFDLEKDGVLRKGISQISKSGYLFLLDRITGQPLTPILDTPVPQLAEQFTAASQPIPQGDTMIDHCIKEAPEGWELVNNGCTYTPFGREPGLYAPLAGSNWMPSSYDPETGYLYVCASEGVGGAYLGDFTEDDLGKQTGGMIYGGNFQLPRGTPRQSYQVAVDVRDHSRVWRTPSTACGAASSVTAGGLLLIGRADRLTVYNSANGEMIKQFQLDAGLYANPVVIEHEGKQKILAFAGGSAFGAGAKGDSVYLLSLDGTIDLSVSELSEAAPAPSFSIVAMPAGEPDLARGQEIYTTVCLACHGEDGQGGHAEGGAMAKDSSMELIFNTATNGIPDKMPAFALAFTPEERKSVAAYIRQSVLNIE